MNPGHIIEIYRKEKGLTIQELADRIGVSRGQLSRMEKGTRTISEENYVKIADALDISLEELLPKDAVRKIDENGKEGLAISLNPDVLNKYSDEELLNFIRLGRSLKEPSE